MRALIYHGKESIVLGALDMPRAKPGEVLVRIAGCGICGSDMHRYHAHDMRYAPPYVLGHEAAGVIEGGPRDGEKVAINPIISCMECDDCRAGDLHLCGNRLTVSLPPVAGAFADYVVVPERNAVPVPPAMDLMHAALSEPTAVSLHAVELALKHARRPRAALKTLVLGAGPIGLLAALILQHAGAGSVTLLELDERRRDLARAGGVRDVAASLPADGSGAQSFDIIVDAVGGDPVRRLVSAAVRRGGTIVNLGLLPGESGLDFKRFILEEIFYLGSFVYLPDEFARAVQLLASGALGPLNWIEQRPLEEGPRAFADIDRNLVAATKVILTT